MIVSRWKNDRRRRRELKEYNARLLAKVVGMPPNYGDMVIWSGGRAV